jgi:GntR family transcriptional repressor for pyruvate dehydrogenase complex
MGEMFDFSLQRDRLSKQVADQIQNLILTESICPGDKLPGERELAERMGISRTVVREAIRVLSVRGLVKVKPGCGTYVRELSPQDAAASFGLFLKLRQTPESFRNVYEVRRMLEVEIAGLAAERGTEEECAAMQAAIDRLSTGAKDAEQFVQIDLDFHLALAAATHNELLGVLLRPITHLWLEVVWISYQAPSAVEDAIFHHSKILDKVRQRNSGQARQAMLDHIRHSQGLVESVRQRSVE